jgi:hypothetical protein
MSSKLPCLQLHERCELQLRSYMYLDLIQDSGNGRYVERQSRLQPTGLSLPELWLIFAFLCTLGF